MVNKCDRCEAKLPKAVIDWIGEACDVMYHAKKTSPELKKEIDRLLLVVGYRVDEF